MREFTDEQRIAGAAQTTFMGKGSHGQPGTQSGMCDTSKEIVKCAAVGSAAPTMLGKMGSHGHASQAGMVDTRRNIVKACGVRVVEV